MKRERLDRLGDCCQDLDGLLSITVIHFIKGNGRGGRGHSNADGGFCAEGVHRPQEGEAGSAQGSNLWFNHRRERDQRWEVGRVKIVERGKVSARGRKGPAGKNPALYNFLSSIQPVLRTRPSAIEKKEEPIRMATSWSEYVGEKGNCSDKHGN